MKSASTIRSTPSNPPSAFNRRWRFIFALCLGIVVGEVNVLAANSTWNGGGAPNFNWSAGADAANWSSAALPTTGNTAIFTNSVGLKNTNDFVTSVTGITFGAGSGAFNLYGNPLTVAGNFTDNAAGVNETINNNIIWDGTAARTATAVSGASLTFAGNVARGATGPGNGLNFVAGATTGTPAVYQFSGSSVTFTNPMQTADGGAAGFTMRNNTTVNLLSGANVSWTGGYFGIGQDGGSTTATNATLNVNSGASWTLDSTANFVIGYNFGHGDLNVNNGILNIRGTVTAALGTSAASYIRLGLNDNAAADAGAPTSGTIDLLTNGVLATSRQIVVGANFDTAHNTVAPTASSGNFIFDGGTLMTDGINDATNWFQSANLTTGTGAAELIIHALNSVQINAGGAFIDTAGRNATIRCGIAPGSTVGGWLFKEGSGTLFLDGYNTYGGIYTPEVSGPPTYTSTLVTNGTLAGSGTITGDLYVYPAGNLGAGDAGAIGTLTVNGGYIYLAGNTTLRINKTGGVKTSDRIVSNSYLDYNYYVGYGNYNSYLTITNITSDGTPLAVGDTFQLFNFVQSFQNFANIVGSPGPGLAYNFNPSTGILSVVSIAQIYAQTLTNGWQDASYNVALNYFNTSPTNPGSIDSISATITSAYGGIQLYHVEMSDIGLASISFWLNGGPIGGQHLQMYGTLSGGAAQSARYYLTTPVANTWQKYTVSLSSLDVANATDFTGFAIQDSAGTAEPAFYLDDIKLNAASPPPVITGISLSGTNLVLNGNNGQSGGTYQTLTTTNLALGPWTPVATNLLNVSGIFSFTATNVVNSTDPQRFFRIVQTQ